VETAEMPEKGNAGAIFFASAVGEDGAGVEAIFFTSAGIAVGVCGSGSWWSSSTDGGGLFMHSGSNRRQSLLGTMGKGRQRERQQAWWGRGLQRR
jgi:hypothetical protein